MKTLTPLQESLQRWIAEELPSVPPLHPETLQLITQGEAAEELFLFLTTRVHTRERTRAIRALLALSKGDDDDVTVNKNVEDDDDADGDKRRARNNAELEKLRAQVLQAERQLSQLRSSIKRQCAERREMSGMQQLGDGYDTVFAGNEATNERATRRAASNALADGLVPLQGAAMDAKTALETLWDDSQKGRMTEEEASDLRDAVRDVARNALTDPPFADELELDLNALVRGSAAATAAALATAVRETSRARAASQPSTLPPSSSPMLLLTSGRSKANSKAGQETEAEAEPNSGIEADVVRAARECAQDAQLRAGAAWREMRAAIARAERRAAAAAADSSLSGRAAEVRVCVAELEAERAVLRFATAAPDTFGKKELQEDGEKVDRFFKASTIASTWSNGDDDEEVKVLADTRAQREAAVANAVCRARDLCAATTRAATASAARLAQLRNCAADAARHAESVATAAALAVEAGERRAASTERALRSADEWFPPPSSPNPSPFPADHAICTPHAALHAHSKGNHSSPLQLPVLLANVRAEDMLAWAAECERVRKGLQARADVVAENRQRVFSRVDGAVTTAITNALRAAREGREQIAAAAQREMRNWATEPAKHAVRCLLHEPSQPQEQQKQQRQQQG